jgi:hypothetical protein
VKNLLLLGVSLIAITGILEVALRIHTPQDVRSFRRPLQHWDGQGCSPLFVHDSIRGARLAPNCTTTSIEPNREYVVTVHSNNHGFRDYKDYRLAKRENVRRVVILGDSFSYGNGVEELARYSNLLDDLLGESIEVYNLALSNYGLDQALLTLESEGLRYGPDLIILGFSDPMLERLSRRVTGSLWSNPFFELERGVLTLSRQPSRSMPAVEAFLAKSYLWRFANQRLAAVFGERDATARWDRNAQVAEPVIGKFAELARQVGSALVIFPINARYILHEAGDSTPALNRWLERLSRSADFHFLDLYPVFARTGYAELYYPIDGHYNTRGHVLVAETLCRFVLSREIIAGIGPGSCDVDEPALYQSLREFRRCSVNDTNAAWFPRGMCIPRE